MDSSIQFIAQHEIAVTLKGRVTDRRQPVHLIFLIDTSDSMSDSDKLNSVKRSLEFIQPLLTPEDLVSMVQFGDDSSVLLNKVAATDKDTILYKINTLKTDGCTNLSAGLMNVRNCLLPSTDRRKQGILLLTDGHANRGVNSPSGLNSIATRLLTDRPDLTITTIGYGHDHNAELLRNIGSTGGGSYNVVYTLENVATVFGEVLGGLTTVVAQNVTIHLPPGSVPKTAYPITQENCGMIQVRVGDIYTENEIVVLATLPSGVDTVRVTGHNMLTFDTQDTLLTAESMSLGGNIPKHIEQAVFRYRVSQLLKRALDHSANHTELKNDTNDLLAQLKDLPYVEEQLIQMMIDDLERILESFTTSLNFGATATNFAQHSAYLGLGRGLRSQEPEDPFNSVHEDPFQAPTRILQSTRSAVIDTTFSPFSNRRQRNVTTTLRATSSAAPNLQ